MGYYSTFEVIDTDIADIKDVLNLYAENFWDGSPCFEYWNYSVHSSDSAKWYDYITDLTLLAQDYPDNYLIMERCGEESPDIWRAVMKHGRVVEIEPELVWPEVQ